MLQCYAVFHFSRPVRQLGVKVFLVLFSIENCIEKDSLTTVRERMLKCVSWLFKVFTVHSCDCKKNLYKNCHYWNFQVHHIVLICTQIVLVTLSSFKTHVQSLVIWSANGFKKQILNFGYKYFLKIFTEINISNYSNIMIPFLFSLSFTSIFRLA